MLPTVKSTYFDMSCKMRINRFSKQKHRMPSWIGITCCLPDIQIQLDVLYFIWQPDSQIYDLQPRTKLSSIQGPGIQLHSMELYSVVSQIANEHNPKITFPVRRYSKYVSSGTLGLVWVSWSPPPPSDGLPSTAWWLD